MDRSNHSGVGLVDLVLPYRVLDLNKMRQIIKFSIVIHYLGSMFIWWVYVDDIVIVRNNVTRISQLKGHLFNQFQNKDLDYLKYFFVIKVA